MREIVLDTETTGLDPADGHRVLEIGAVEIVHQSLTGKVFHVLINPERDVPQDAARVHGHTAAGRSGTSRSSPASSTIFSPSSAISNLVIHNADFDMRFVNAELARLGLAAIGMDRVVDTLTLARKKHPGQPNSLDALCDRYRIDRSRRVRHGALARRGNPGRGLLRTDGRPPAVAHAGRRCRPRGRRRRPRSCSLRAAAAKAILARARGGGRSRALYRKFIVDAIWFRYLRAAAPDLARRR